MAQVGAKKGHPKWGGKKKGTKNKFTCLKESFLQAFNDIGGTVALASWAKDNQKDFYQMLSKMLPHEITGENGAPIQVVNLSVKELAESIKNYDNKNDKTK